MNPLVNQNISAVLGGFVNIGLRNLSRKTIQVFLCEVTFLRQGSVSPGLKFITRNPGIRIFFINYV